MDCLLIKSYPGNTRNYRCYHISLKWGSYGPGKHTLRATWGGGRHASYGVVERIPVYADDGRPTGFAHDGRLIAAWPRSLREVREAAIAYYRGDTIPNSG